jgi:hypothetical protein
MAPVNDLERVYARMAGLVPFVTIRSAGQGAISRMDIAVSHMIVSATLVSMESSVTSVLRILDALTDIVKLHGSASVRRGSLDSSVMFQSPTEGSSASSTYT